MSLKDIGKRIVDNNFQNILEAGYDTYKGKDRARPIIEYKDEIWAITELIYSSIELIEPDYLEILNGYSKEVYFMNATDISLERFGSNQQVNLIMLGFAIATEKIPFIEIPHYEEVINEWLRDPELNIEALHFGLEEGKKIIENAKKI